MEIWLTVKGFKNYSISNFGSVRRELTRTCSKKGKILKSCSNGRYLNVSLQNDGIGKTCQIHQLVAETFICPRPQGLEINHKDGNKLNNHVENLEYVTKKENAQHAIRLGLIKPQRGSKHWRSILTEIKVIEIRKLHSSGITQRKIAKIYKVHFGTINEIVLRHTWKHI